MESRVVKTALFSALKKGADDLTEILWMDTRILEDAHIFQRAMRRISDARRQKIERLQNPLSARLSLGAGILLSMALEQAKLLERQNEILFDAHGKPFLPNVPFHFSLSHSGHGALCAFGTDPIGADLQEIKSQLPQHTDRILSAAEKKYLDAMTEKERVCAFYRLWARKESLMKWDGRGLRLKLDTLSFVENGQLSDKIAYEGKMLFIREYRDFLPEYAVSICSESPHFSPVLKKILII